MDFGDLKALLVVIIMVVIGFLCLAAVFPDALIFLMMFFMALIIPFMIGIGMAIAICDTKDDIKEGIKSSDMINSKRKENMDFLIMRIDSLAYELEKKRMV